MTDDNNDSHKEVSGHNTTQLTAMTISIQVKRQTSAQEAPRRHGGDAAPLLGFLLALIQAQPAMDPDWLWMYIVNVIVEIEIVRLEMDSSLYQVAKVTP